MLIGPGHTVFTRMPRGASSAPNDRRSERTAAFGADRMERPGVPAWSRNEIVTRTLPPSAKNGCEQYVDTAEFFGDLPDDAFNLGGLANVTAQHGYVSPSWLAADRNPAGFCPTITTVAPSSRNNFAASNPMPEVPPVTRTTLSASLMTFLRVRYVGP